MQERLDRTPHAMSIRRATVEHPFGTLKAWMGASHFRTRTLDKVRTEMSFHVPAYNLKRMIAILGVQPLMQAMRACVVLPSLTPNWKRPFAPPCRVLTQPGPKGDVALTRTIWLLRRPTYDPGE